MRFMKGTNDEPHCPVHAADLVEMVAMIQTHILTALIAAAVAAVCAWIAQDWRYEGQIAQLHAQHAQALADAKQQALDAAELSRRAQQAINDKYQGALNDARQREAVIRRNADAAARESDGLRAQLSDAARRIADAPPAAVAEHAVTVGGLFADCSRDYQGMAAKASGHAADVRALVEAWPVTPGAVHDHPQD